MTNDIFLSELTPIENGGENENGSGFPKSVPMQIKNSSIRPCDAIEMRILRHQHYKLIEDGQSIILLQLCSNKWHIFGGTHTRRVTNTPIY